MMITNIKGMLLTWCAFFLSDNPKICINAILIYLYFVIIFFRFAGQDLKGMTAVRVQSLRSSGLFVQCKHQKKHANFLSRGASLKAYINIVDHAAQTLHKFTYNYILTLIYKYIIINSHTFTFEEANNIYANISHAKFKKKHV